MECIRVTLLMERERGMEHFSGIMGRNLKEIGRMGLRKVLEFGDHQKEIPMRESGIITGNKVKELLGIKIVHTLVSL